MVHYFNVPVFDVALFDVELFIVPQLSVELF